MKWLPYDCWTVDSPLDVPALVAGMRERIEPTKWFRWPGSRDHAPLQGAIHERGFTASRIIHYRNSSLPVFYGTFTPTPRGTTIRVRMMPHPVVIVFMALWFSCLGLFGFVGSLAAVHGGTWCLLSVVGSMGAIALVAIWGGYFLEAGKTKRLLSQVFLEVHKEAADKSARATM